MDTQQDARVVVCGAGGFIGGHLVATLREQGLTNLRAVDVKPYDHWYQRFDDVENLRLNLQQKTACQEAVKDCAIVYNLAADMGGMAFIENNKALCMLSVLINTHLLMAARAADVQRFFFASSACVYAHNKQTDPNVTGLRKRMRIRPCPRTDMDGRNYSANACAGTSRRTLAWSPVSLASTTCTVPTGPSTADARRRPPPSAAR